MTKRPLAIIRHQKPVKSLVERLDAHERYMSARLEEIKQIKLL